METIFVLLPLALLIAAIAVVTVELVALALIRVRFFKVSFASSIASITLGGAIIVAVSALLGSAG